MHNKAWLKCTINLWTSTKLPATIEGGKLKFFSFHNARQMFDLSEYYKVATDDDVLEFAGLDIVQTSLWVNSLIQALAKCLTKTNEGVRTMGFESDLVNNFERGGEAG